MKKTLSVLVKVMAVAILLTSFYLVIADGMMTLFGFSRGIQYAFNMGAMVILFPLGLYYFLGLNESEDSVRPNL